MLFDTADTPAANIYKIVLSTIVPRPIAWVTTQDIDGTVNAAPFSCFNTMTDDPPILAFGMGPGVAGAKDTAGNISRTGQFVVNLVSHSLGVQMNETSFEFPKDVDELAEVGLTQLASHRVKPPRIAEAPVSFECERLMALDVGKGRTIVLGKILAIHVQDEFVLDRARGYVKTVDLDLIGRMQGPGTYARTTDRFEMLRPKRS